MIAPPHTPKAARRGRPSPRPSGLALVIGGLLAVALLGSATACATWQGARLYDRGSHALQAGRTDAAIADLEEAARLVPRASEIQNHLGLAYAAAGRPDEALAAFRRAEALDCSNRAATENRLALEAQMRTAAVGATTPGPGGAR